MLLLFVASLTWTGLIPVLLMALGALAFGAVSIAPSDAVETGLLNDVNVTIKTAETCLYDFNGKVDPAATCLALALEDEEGKEHIQYFSAGKQDYFVPSDDGTTFIPVQEGKNNMNASTNFMKFMESLVNCGFPEDKLRDGNVKVLEGMKVHITRIAAPKRGGLINAKGAGDREQTILVVDQILEYPGEAAAKPKTGMGAKPMGKAAPAAKGAPAAAKGAPAKAVSSKPVPAAAPADADELDETLAGVLVGLLAEQGGSIPKSKIASLVFKAPDVQGPNKQKYVARSFNDQFLESRGEWTYDGATVTLAE